MLFMAGAPSGRQAGFSSLQARRVAGMRRIFLLRLPATQAACGISPFPCLTLRQPAEYLRGAASPNIKL